MPSSHPGQLNEIVNEIRRVNPERLLDIGVGFGKYGFLAREYLELWDGRERIGDWQRTIDGIEAHGPYIGPWQEAVYDSIHIGDALTILPGLGSYDLILIIDCLEHFECADGEALLREAVQHGPVLVSVPKSVDFSQADAFGNPYEVHRSQWSVTDLRSIAPCKTVRNDASIICHLSGGM